MAGPPAAVPANPNAAGDLSDGTWAARHRALLDQTELDCGYRLIVGRK